jgi:hypothetical protein
MTIIDVDTWSKAAAKEYLTAGTALNTSIEKIASEHGLNRDQVNRVVEAANTEVYVQMFNQSPDKYIQFDSADSEKIAEKLFGVEKTSQFPDDDYQDAPIARILQEEYPMEKVAEVETNTTNTDSLHEYYKLAALESRLGQSMDEVEMHYQNDVSVLASMIKQAVLGGASFGDIQKALFTVYDDPVVKININEMQEKLAAEFYPRKLNMTINEVGTVNMENSIVKQAGLLLKHAQEFKSLKSKHAEAHSELIGHLKTSEKLGLTGAAKLASAPQQAAAVAKTGLGLKGGAALALGSAAVGAYGADKVRKTREQQGIMRGQMRNTPIPGAA